MRAKEIGALQTELTSGRAVGSLKRAIAGKESGAFRTAFRIFMVAVKGIAADIALLFIMLPFMPAYWIASFIYIIIAALVFAVFAWHAFRKCPAHRGILLGKEYRRHVLQYSNTDSKEGSRPELRGSGCEYMLDLVNEPNQHVLIAGSSSSGKTTTLKALLARSSIKYGISFLAIDWQGELERFAEESGATLWRVPGNFMINIFRLNSMDVVQRSAMVEEALMLALQLTQLQATRVRDALTKLYNGSEPTLQMLWDSLSERRDNRLIGYRLKAVERVIGPEPASFWDSLMKGSAVLSLAGLNDNEKSLVTYFILQRVCELFEKGSINSKPRLLIAVDEAWQLMSRQQHFMKMPNAHEVLAEKIVRLGRKYGFGIITSTQQLDDLPDAFINSSSVIILHSYRQQWRNNTLSLNPLDIEYARSAAQGECLVMDRSRAQKGQTWLDYVKVTPLSSDELTAFKSNSNVITQPADLQPQAIQISTESRHGQRKGITSIPQGAPTPSEHAAMLAISMSENPEKQKLVGFIKNKGWISSDATIYGYRGKPGIMEKVVSAGFAKEENGKYSLTEQGRKWVDPDYIMANQSDKLGSEEHKRLMAKTISKLHEENMLVITSSLKHSPDLISFPVSKAKRYLWDVASAMGYEVQTSARKEAIEMNEAKTGLQITWVAEDGAVLEEIKQLTGQRDKYWII